MLLKTESENDSGKQGRTYNVPVVPIPVGQIHALGSALQLNSETVPDPLLVGAPGEAGVNLEFVPIDDLSIGVIQTFTAMDDVLTGGSDGPKLILRVGNAVLNCDDRVIGVDGGETFGIGEGGVDDLVGLDNREGSDSGDGGH